MDTLTGAAGSEEAGYRVPGSRLIASCSLSHRAFQLKVTTNAKLCQNLYLLSAFKSGLLAKSLELKLSFRDNYYLAGVFWTNVDFKGIDRSFELRGKIRLIRSVMTNWRLGNFFMSF